MTIETETKKAKGRMKFHMLWSILFSGFFFFGLLIFDFNDLFKIIQLVLVGLICLVNIFFWFRYRNRLIELMKEADWREKK